MQSFLRFAREEVHLTDQEHLRQLFSKFCEEAGFLAIGTGARSAQLSRTMAEAMLQLHMKDGTKSKQNAKAISELLNTKFFHHGYPLNREEAKRIGLKIGKADKATEELMWEIWKDIEADLKLREPFLPMSLFKADANCQALFAPVPQLSLPPGAPQPVVQMFAQVLATQMATHVVPPTTFENTVGLMESARCGSRARVQGSIFAARQPDLTFRIQIVPEAIGWVDAIFPAETPQISNETAT